MPVVYEWGMVSTGEGDWARRRVWPGLVAGVLLLATACSSTTTARPLSTAAASPSLLTHANTSAPPSPLANALPVAGGCGSTQLYKGGMPAWVHDGTQGLSGMEDLPYVLAGPTAVAGFVFSYPLKAGTIYHDGPKILWIVSTPRNGRPLEIRAHPAGASTPEVAVSRPADSGPGEIYPDGVPIPTAGCWDFTLRWATGNAELELLYSS